MRRSSGKPQGGKNSQRPQSGGSRPTKSSGRPPARVGHGPARSGPSQARGAANHGAHSSLPKSWRQIAGTHAVKEALSVRPQSIKQAYVQSNLLNSPDIKELLQIFKANDIRFEEKNEMELAKMCAGHQGAVICSDYNPAFDYTQQGWENKSMIVALDGVEDPHNLGAILRTSWLMGVSGLIIPQDRAVGLTPTVHKVACGGAEHVEIARINNFNDPFETLKASGFWVYGLSHKATKSIYDIQYPEKVIWVLGAEDKGLRSTTERACDELVSIPQASADASYNVSVATAMALAETKRQWTKK
ncbi:MAG: 23S rRNA (guanosine(2251)-2'-O)-methyltransferase RlmB [Bdellovibrionota bacterium]